MAFGVRTPTVLIPSSLLDADDDGHVETILAHELADVHALGVGEAVPMLTWLTPEPVAPDGMYCFGGQPGPVPTRRVPDTFAAMASDPRPAPVRRRSALPGVQSAGLEVRICLSPPMSAKNDRASLKEAARRLALTSWSPDSSGYFPEPDAGGPAREPVTAELFSGPGGETPDPFIKAPPPWHPRLDEETPIPDAFKL
ncbi:MAG: hypothetical protein ACYS5V_17880, partial [Planctomycetota bacterium]